jgi:Fic family protein
MAPLAGDAMTRTRTTGRRIDFSTGGDSYSAFVPDPLPPDPPLSLSGSMQDLRDRANRALGRLDGIAGVLPETSLFVYMYVRKEAVLSSQIEGTQSSLSELLLFESEQVTGVPLDDVEEVSKYVAAMKHGLQRLGGGFPLSLRLIREIHGVLLSEGRGSERTPGEFRRSQNWIGGTRPGNAVFVPPPPDMVIDCMGALEKFLQDDPVKTPVLIKAALAHVQFESIHPFLDGNGRLGRLLITLLLCAEGAQRHPLLYLSLYFKRHRQTYYDLLQKVRSDGDWETWVEFFLSGVVETAEQASDAADAILRLFDEDRKRIEALGRSASSALRIHAQLRKAPLISIPVASKRSGLSGPTVAGSMKRLADLGIVRETTGNRRNRVFVYERFVGILNEGTEPTP